MEREFGLDIGAKINTYSLILSGIFMVLGILSLLFYRVEGIPEYFLPAVFVMAVMTVFMTKNAVLRITCKAAGIVEIKTPLSTDELLYEEMLSVNRNHFMKSINIKTKKGTYMIFGRLKDMDEFIDMIKPYLKKEPKY